MFVSVLYHIHPLKNYKKCSIFYFFKIGIMHKVFASKLYNIHTKAAAAGVWTLKGGRAVYGSWRLELEAGGVWYNMVDVWALGIIWKI